ncbi:pyruvate decarboxylase [Acetobacter nitrogenifigens DSM 23921 = NBRC 105050]|uniref:pyruvate decarboxylase n=4 Tax=Acetobacter TaxID=434 RepID=A0A511XEP0_9PROT|nr:thiamine pyrophosphate-dependent enzyme [Acetobacter nitrogenifigens]GBQ96635.1 pyruvate decarboxylase [Acetobacter nitrogenifigens DSM 23921 = NBRC 105050]GEN61398.1 pyruvate decarboxylase [Acetobacter nitrogenifigens DSM 23921 = NBRC 105050]
MSYTVGTYLAERFAQIGLKHHFAVAGDYNLVLLDQLLKNRECEQVYCSNELNCGFSAEGYARANGAAAAVVTFSVGALSALNAIGGAYAENLPVILVSGAPNSNDHGSGHILHHTIGTTDYGYQLRIAKELTCAAVSITSAEDAPEKIDYVIRTALREKKPAYIEIACNVSGQSCRAPGPISAVVSDAPSDADTLKAAVKAVAEFIEKKEKPVILIGSKLRAAGAEEAAIRLADALGCSVATMGAAKSFFPEDHPGYIGTFWGSASSPKVNDVFNWADGVLALACIFNDYSTEGWTEWPKGANVVNADKEVTKVADLAFDSIHLRDLLDGVAKQFAGKAKKDATMVEYRRIGGGVAENTMEAPAKGGKLTREHIQRTLQSIVTSETTIFGETGDSWFNVARTKLPRGARVEYEMQWGHIGWSVPAMFGYAVATPERRNILMVGDGSFQLTAQEVGQMVRRKLPVIIFLINNAGYTIEVEIHDGPYNNIKNWDYAAVVEGFNAEDGKGKGLRATTIGELDAAVKAALAHKDGPVLIECVIPRDDCTSELISWGRHVATANARPPAH